MIPKYPEIEVELSGVDGNVFSILGKVRSALRKAKVPNEDIQEFTDEATSGDYDHALQTCMDYVDVS